MTALRAHLAPCVEPLEQRRNQKTGSPSDRPDAPGVAPTPDAARTGQTRRSLVRSHQRFETRSPAVPPPPLRCRSCDRVLQYLRSYIGGVNARLSEQWDHYSCSGGCGQFEYRHRTRRVRRIE
jgi:hypothetical protein